MDSVKLIQDFLTFNGRLEKQPFIKRYIVVFLLMYGFFYLGGFLGMPLLSAVSSVFIIPQVKTFLVLVGLMIPLVSLISLVFLCWGKSDPYRNQFG